MTGKKKCILLLALAAVTVASFALLAGCGKKKGYQDADKSALMLHLAFDEGSGTAVKDSAGKASDATLNYVFTDPEFQPQSQDPQWRETGVLGGSLLFDGYSNYIQYKYDEVKVKGSAFTVAAWVAPRAFEWDDPNAVKNDTEHLTVIAGQFDKQMNQGFALGYQRHGDWSFQVGLGDRWVEIWDGGHPLVKYEWNYVAATFDGTAGLMTLYLNGEKVNEKKVYKNARIEPALDVNFYVSRSNEPTSNATATCNMVSGLIDELKLYSAAVSAEHILDYYTYCLKDGKRSEITFEDIWLVDVLGTDVHKPQYHGGPPQHWMNEPHAPMYYNGKYHLFFQFNLFGPYFRNICWGHLVSDDMVNWKAMKEIITPGRNSVAPDGIWSGGVTYDSEGKPVIFFTAGNDSWQATSGLISNQNIGIARPKDTSDPYLTEWVVDSELAIAQAPGQGTPGEFRDPSVIKLGDTWYMLVCTKREGDNGGTALVYTTKDDDFHNWTYRGPVYEMESAASRAFARTWELPVLLPVDNGFTGTERVEKFALIVSPAPADQFDNSVFYWVGQFDTATCRFTPDFSQPRLLDYGNKVFTGPSGFVDPVSGRSVIFSIMQDQRKPHDQYLAGWAHNVGLAREIYLSADGSDLCVRPIEELAAYRTPALVDETGALSLSAANAALAEVDDDMLYVKMRVRNVSAKRFGIDVRRSADGMEKLSYFYDAENGKAGVGSSGRSLAMLPGNVIELELYIDRSLVEGFFNGDKAVTARTYPKGAAGGLKLFADGEIEVQRLLVTGMKSIHT